jgi:hypothetical protein
MIAIRENEEAAPVEMNNGDLMTSQESPLLL